MASVAPARHTCKRNCDLNVLRWGGGKLIGRDGDSVGCFLQIPARIILEPEKEMRFSLTACFCLTGASACIGSACSRGTYGSTGMKEEELSRRYAGVDSNRVVFPNRLMFALRRCSQLWVSRGQVRHVLWTACHVWPVSSPTTQARFSATIRSKLKGLMFRDMKIMHEKKKCGRIGRRKPARKERTHSTSVYSYSSAPLPPRSPFGSLFCMHGLQRRNLLRFPR